MFFLLYLINFLNFFFCYNIKYFNYFYLFFNKSNLIYQKNFEGLTFFEKFFLVIFYQKNLFFKFFFKNYDEPIYYLRTNNYPLINFIQVFSFYDSNTKNNVNDIFFLKNHYEYFNHKYYGSMLNSSISFFMINKKYFNFLNVDNLIHESNNTYFYKILLSFKRVYFFKGKFLKFFYNLNYYNDWFNYNFNKNNFFKKNFKKNSFKYKNKFILNKKHKLLNLSKYYNKILKTKNEYISSIFIKYCKTYKLKYNYLLLIRTFRNFFLNKNMFFFKKINIFIKKNILIRFNESSLNKLINKNTFKNFEFYYIRKNKIFNKSRYSRNRQLYRTGVYWCLWLNIIIVYGLYFFFYRFVFNFGYIWFGLFIIFFSTIFSRILKYKFYNIYNLIKEFSYMFNWFGFIFLDILNIFKFFPLRDILKKNLIIFNYLNNLVYIVYKFFLSINIYLNKKKDLSYIYAWKFSNLNDKSFLKYKSILNWFVQFYKALIY